MYYVFDVDGTLTPSRGVMDPKFAAWFKEFAKTHTVCYATGSDKDKTVEQIGQEMFDLAEYSFNCAGNEVYQKGQQIYKSDWVLSDDAWLWLEDELYKSQYPHRVGKHLEQRTGLLNFSIVGRNAKGLQRTEYCAWDRMTNERTHIARSFNHRFPDLQAQIGGETGIDIFPRGCDKSQVVKYLTAPVKFYGDGMAPDGNDRPLADKILDNDLGECYTVTNWKHTWKLLKNDSTLSSIRHPKSH